MATESTQQILDGSVDAAGVSIVTATRTTTDPRKGIIYNPATFAAAPPVWFHRLHDGRYLALFKNRWHTATSVYHDGPQTYSAHNFNTQPCYAVIDPTTGTVDGPYNWSGLDTLSSAVSRGDYLFTLGEKDGDVTVQHWVITRYGGLQLQADEQVPLGYSLGLWADGFNLRVFGANEDGFLASVRKNWGRIGVNTGTDPANQWWYEGTKGWYTRDYLDQAAPMPPGTIPAQGPVSVAQKGDRLYLMVTEHVAGAYSARVYTTRTVDAAWKLSTTLSVFLGNDTDYLGGTAYLQPQLVTTSPGFAYVTSQRVVSGSDQAMLTEWGILTV